ncbi:hypothetical protein Celaphus_00018099 [Cervus elaphus hippelaphus]|uniref:Uncharacterized protein n=1 Tax=Cervus elaphus hippelaphus TaxID=46360 RepID=A0A212C887_CEREH|nr:hypothetical protein Celaphus_00018099 [Cervus elaphus hippelaphus]
MVIEVKLFKLVDSYYSPILSTPRHQDFIFLVILSSISTAISMVDNVWCLGVSFTSGLISLRYLSSSAADGFLKAVMSKASVSSSPPPSSSITDVRD